MSPARFDTSDPAYRDLLSVVLRSEAAVVPFVGAGLSVYGEPGERLPFGGKLLEQLVAEGMHLGLIPETGDSKIDDVLRRGRYIDAAEELLKALGEPTFRRVVERELDDTGKPVPPGIAELVAVNWALIVTTNLDRLISRAYLDRHKRPPTTITGTEARRLTGAISETLIALDTTLAQIHGVLDVFESWKLTRAHYTQLLQDPAYMTALENLFLKRVFFIGYGLQDDDFDFVLKTVASIYPAGMGTYYALVPHSRKQDPALLNLVRRGGFQPIFYEVDAEPDEADPFCGHRAVYECLNHLASEWVAEKVNLDVTLKYFPEPDPNMIERPEIALLTGHIAEGSTVTQVVGLGGLGKTSLVQQFLQEKRSEIVTAGYDHVFGCSFYRADIGQFIQDMALAIIGPEQRPLPQQVERICAHVRQHRMLLVLDGLEAILDADATLLSPYVLQVLESVVSGQGGVVVTSRVVASGGVLDEGKEVEIEPFSPAQILAFLRNWGLEGLGDAANTRLAEITAGHPLALRILAGVLQDVPPTAAIATIENSAVIDVTDEVDPLRENRLARIFGSYFHHLDESEIAFLDCLTAFERPVGFPLIESSFTRSYADTAINQPLINSNLRPTVAQLLERRLLTVSPLGELSCHPTVREYFARHVSEGNESLAPVHRYLAHETLRESPSRPDGFEEAMTLVTACRHAGEGRDWELFDDLFAIALCVAFATTSVTHSGPGTRR